MQSAITTPADNAAAPPTSVFILGGMTAVGRDLARMLVRAGHRVTATCTTASEAALLRADGVLPAYPNLGRAGELRSAFRAAAAQVVVNLTPQASNVPPQLNPHFEPVLVQHAGTLMEAAAAAGVEFVVHTSYAFLDGEAHGEDADDLLEPAEAVLNDARAAEAVLLAASVPACVLRFGYLYGAGVPEITRLMAELKGSVPVAAGEAHARAPWLQQADAATAVALAIAKRPAGLTLTIADTQPATPAAFMKHFAAVQGLTVGSGRALPLPGRGLRPVTKALMTLDFVGSSASAAEALGWTPRFPTYVQGIDDLLLTWRAGLAAPKPVEA